jgi:MFS family permease
MTDHPRAVKLLLNVAHALDHLFLLIFATAVATIASEFGFSRWEDLMPYGVGAFFLFGVGSLPAGKLGDSWGRRQMMLTFFFGIGIASLLTAMVTNAWQLAAALTLIGAFASIYHPVGIPMLIQNARNPGATIGMNGLAGNLGVAAAAILTGLLIKWVGWRAAFAVPGIIAIACGVVFAKVCPRETEAPAKRSKKAPVSLSPADMARAFLVMTIAAITASLLFNFTTNGNGHLLEERFRGIVTDPAWLGVLLALVYVVASFSQLIVGRLIDRYPIKRLFLWILVAQAPVLFIAAYAQGWWLYGLLILSMILIFGAIPFTDAMIARYIDDRLRSRVSGVRLAVSFGISSLAVWLLGPVVKAAGFQTLLTAMAVIALVTLSAVLFLPEERQAPG